MVRAALVVALAAAACGRLGFAEERAEDASDGAVVDSSNPERTTLVVDLSACPDGVDLLGVATCSGGGIQLTPNVTEVSGGAVLLVPLALTPIVNLEIEIDLAFVGLGDGIAVVLHSDPRGRVAHGSPGAAFGMSGISPSVGIELDTFVNPWDPPGSGMLVDHVGLDLDASWTSVATGNVRVPSDGTRVTLKIQHVGTTGQLTITFDGVVVLTTTADLARLGSNVWLAVTGATGGRAGVQSIVGWRTSTW